MKTALLKLRGMRYVTRFSNSPRIKDNNIAEHSYYVQQYTYVMCKILNVDMTYNMCIYCMMHDAHEGVAFDIPANVKRSYLDSDKIEEVMKTDIVEMLDDVDMYIRPVEKQVIKLADILDALITSCEEVSMGNRFFKAPKYELASCIMKQLSTIKEFYSIDKYKYAELIMFIYDLFCDLDISIKEIDHNIDYSNITHTHKGFK